MTGAEFNRELWPDITSRAEYERLVGLARRRLLGYEHHAEDVVSRAMMKWATIPLHKRTVARIEQVIKTEAFSLLRSEHRARERETRVGNDPTQSGGDRHNTDRNLRLLRQALAATCKRERARMTLFDWQVLELILAGFNPTEVERTLEASRYEVRKSRRKWKRIVELTLTDDEFTSPEITGSR